VATVEIERTEILTPFPEPAPTEPDPALDEGGKVLMRAAKIVREGWTQFELCSKDGKRFCLLGAVHQAAGHDVLGHRTGSTMLPNLSLSVGDRLFDSLGFAFVAWNNDPNRTAEEVALALERAAIGA
jgi:hypothetical protein